MTDQYRANMSDRVSNIVEQIRVNLQRQYPQIQPPARPINTRNIPKFGTGQQSVSTTPVQLVGPRAKRTSIKITNLGGVEVFLGNSVTVSTTTGDLLCAGRGQWVSYDTESPIFAVIASGTSAVAWSEVYE